MKKASILSLVVAAIALIFFGPQRLPELGRSLGQAIRGFKESMREVESEGPPGKNDGTISRKSS